jgi:hypothetical protein
MQHSPGKNQAILPKSIPKIRESASNNFANSFVLSNGFSNGSNKGVPIREDMSSKDS